MGNSSSVQQATGNIAAGAINTGRAFSHGLAAVRDNVAALMVPTALLALLTPLVLFTLPWLSDDHRYAYQGLIDRSSSLTDQLGALGFIVAFLAPLIVACYGVVYRAAYLITEKGSASITEALAGIPWGSVIVFSTIALVLNAAGLAFLVFPQLFVGLVLQFGLPAIIDRSAGGLTAVSASFSVVKSNIQPSVAIFALSALMGVLGVVSCGLLFIVGLPVIAVAQTFIYRRAMGKPIA